ncbi:MAG: TonB-dependent receptor [Acidobacteriia bacterium]|nr:TonB-dependent receptor [Terriglobia bacterium]
MRTTLLAAAVLSFGLPLAAQTFGGITGRVSDSSGAAVPGSNLTLTNTSTNANRQTTSGDDGFYDFPSVPPGIYNVKAEHAGFKATSSINVEVQVQQSVRLDFTLEVGQRNETVQVEATAELLQSSDATVGTVIQTQSIAQLPLNGREYLNLVTLAPNVSNLAPPAGQAQSRQGGDRANQSISAGGNRIVFDYFTLDGIVNTDPNFNTYVVLPSIDAIQEFKVQTGVYPAEFGHEATQINVLTKSGGNAFHGSLFEFVRNNDFDALPYQFTATKPGVSPFKWNDYGFELDGPVRIPKLFNGRDRLFFMTNYEALVQRQTQLGVFSVPTPAMFGGDFSQLGTTIYDPTTKTPFPGNIVPSSMISPYSQQLLKYYDASTLPGLTNNYTQNLSSPFNRDMYILRMDFVESSKSQWSGRYSWGSEVQKAGGINISGSKIVTGYEQYMGSNTRVLTPNLLNEARFGYSRFYNSLGAISQYSQNIVSELSLPNLTPGPPVTWGIPSVTFATDGFSAFGDNSDGPYQNQNNTAQFVDNVSWIKGKHAFKFGFEYDRQNFNQLGNQYSRGQYSFNPNATQSASHTGGDAFAEFLLGDVFQSTIAVAAAQAAFQRNAEAAFIDDTWKATPKLTLSLGLRYELTPPFTDQINNLFIVHVPHIYASPGVPQADWPYFVRQGNCSDPYSANPAIFIRWTLTPAVCSNGLLPNQLMDTRYTDFAPRVGIAYSLDSKTVIRTGFGMFYSQDQANSPYFDLARNLAARVSTIAQTGAANIGYNNAFPSTSGLTVPVGAPYAYSDNPLHHTPYTLQYLFNIQRQFGQDWSVEVGYLGSVSHHLFGFMNQNEGIPSPVGTAASHLPFGDYTFIQSVEDMGNGEYNSFSVKITKRFSRGLNLMTAYTHGVSIDDTSGIRVQGYDTLFPQNSYCIRCERGFSSFDTRNRLVLSPLYELPVGKGKPLNITNSFANAIIGGWQAGGIFTVQSGIPQTLTIGGVDNSLTQSGYDRPNATGAGSAASNQSPAGWYNRAAFVEAPVAQFGNVGRDSAIAPGIFTINGEVHKNFRMPYKENHQLQFRAEAFNLLNHPNWGGPNGNILAGAPVPGAPANAAHQGFGTISTLAAGIPMRQLQLGLKYTF